jgi:hypothetical protein
MSLPAVTKSFANHRHAVCALRITVSVVVVVAIAITLLATPLHAQLYSGSLTGHVVDPSGAMVPNAKVTLTDVGKQYQYKATADGLGLYLLRPLPPSTYRLAVEAKGFTPYTQDGVVLDVNQNATIDVTLRVGAINEKVIVTGEAPQLAAQDATTGQEVNQVFVNNLPLINREIMDLTFLAPGVNPAPGASFGSIAGEWTGNNFTSNGSRNAQSDVLVDGVSSTGYEQNSAVQIPLYRPSPDAVQEFKVEQNNFSAEMGYSGGTVVNMVTKSGTNQFHGSLYEYWRNQILDANNWYNDQQGIPQPPLRYNDFGVTFGGPIRKNKTFFFVDYEGNRIRSGTGTIQAGVPSQAERNGDFSELCGYQGGTFATSGPLVGQCVDSTGALLVAGQLWDPYVGNNTSSGVVHTNIIPNNRMDLYQSPGNPSLDGTGYQLPAKPGNLIDPVAAKMMSYYPLPNNFTGGSGGAYNPYNNWAASATNQNDHDQIDVRVDQQFNEKNTASVRFSWGRNPWLAAQAFHNPLTPDSGGPAGFGPREFSLNDTHTFNPNTVLTVAYGFTRVLHQVSGINKEYPQFDPVKDLGLPAYIESSGYKAAPSIILDDYNYGMAGYGWISIGAQPWSIQRYSQETHHVTGSLSHVRGQHELKLGAEMRVLRVNSSQPGTPDGLFSYDFGTTEKDPDDGGGDALASFLTGVGTWGWGQYEFPVATATQNFRNALYALDNWKITSKLTLNLGVRYELEIPRTERYNKMSWFDPKAVSPLPALPCYASEGEPCLSNLHGGLVYASNSERHVADINYHGIAPRIGLAWRVRPSTVVRSGYGIFYQPSEYGAAGVGVVGYDGFDTTTYWATNNGDPTVPWGRLSDPFPNGLVYPFGSSRGLATYLGNGVDGVIRNWNALPYTQTWSLGIQHQLPFGILVDAAYVGTKGTHLYFYGAQNLNYLGPWVKSLPADSPNNTDAQPCVDLTMACLANGYVDNPFYNIITDPTAPLSYSQQVPMAQLYMPYPQFTGVTGSTPPIASSTYHALQIRVERRMSRGLQFLATYVNSKSIDNATLGSHVDWLSCNGCVPFNPVDPTDPSRERSISQTDIPQVFSLAWVYQLPFGKGKSWGGSWNSWVNGLLGGWQINGTWRLDNGTPLQIYQQHRLTIPGGYGHRPNLLAPLRRNHGSNWRDQYFANPQDAVATGDYTLGDAPRFLSSVRAPGNNVWTMALSKDFGLGMLHEGTILQFRLETFNALNHPQFCGPHTTVDSDANDFGQVMSQCNSPREVQLGLRLTF